MTYLNSIRDFIDDVYANYDNNWSVRDGANYFREAKTAIKLAIEQESDKPLNEFAIIQFDTDD